METALRAERDGTIAEVLVRAGDQIDAKDLAGRLRIAKMPPREYLQGPYGGFFVSG